MGGNAEENTAFRPMCFGTGAEGFCVIKKKKELKKTFTREMVPQKYFNGRKPSCLEPVILCGLTKKN